jgi:RHS repeat-associated protein
MNAFAREDYLHDDNGNRLSVKRRSTVGATTAAESDTYSIAPGTNRLTGITTPGGTRSFTHDARGNQTGETRPDGSTVTVAYDGRARLTSYTVGSATQTMLYNGADERIRVVTTPASGPVDTRQFVYDLDHRIVGEYGAGGATDLKAEYIWLLPEVGASGPTGGDDGTGGYTPLAVAVGVAGQSGITSEVQWVHANHLGTPILTTNASGQAVTPYGYAAIGFPGQFANALLLPGAEHYYNRYRDYDPSTGRYIQADPIGLAGGENAYQYALSNPLRYTDPQGLHPGDKWFGYNDKEFQRWFHRCWKQPGDGDANKAEIKEAYAEWSRLGKPKGGKCGGDPRRNPAPQKQPICNDGCKDTVKKTAIGAGILYIGYRCFRMLPSLAPPLWGTIPANAAIP